MAARDVEAVASGRALTMRRSVEERDRTMEAYSAIEGANRALDRLAEHLTHM
ncbi:MAG: hypothetical protein WEE64_11140 [Dehalococcoidia bacterium]